MVNTNFVFTTDPCGSELARDEAINPSTKPQGSNPIPRNITLVTVCTARSNCMSDSGW